MTPEERAALQPYIDRFGVYLDESQKAVGTKRDKLWGPASLAATKRAIQNARLAQPPSRIEVGERVPLSTFTPATNYTWANRSEVRWVVIHDMEAAEAMTTAENVAKWFASPGDAAPRASAHYCVDADSIVPCVREKHVAWGAKGGNRYGVHYEFAGYAAQTSDEWLDAYGRRMFAVAAPYIVDTCRRWGIPIRKIGPSDVADGEKGICGHYDITKAFDVPGGHYDPGPGFPWYEFMQILAAADAADGKG